MSMTRPLSLATGFLACLLLAACGGGGGDGAPSADASLLDGTYFFNSYALASGAPDAGTSIWAVAALDGSGGFAGTAGRNAAGVITGPTPLNGTYTVAGDRETTLVLADGHAGWTDAGGSLALVGSVTPASAPAAATLVRLGSGFADTDLQGDWCLGILALDPAGTATRSFWGSVTLDALGEGTATVTANVGGMLSAPAPVGVDFDVAGNGQVSSTFDGSMLEGVVHASKDLIILSGVTDNAGDYPVWVVYVRKTSGASDALLSGTYQIVGLERDGGGFSSITGSASANGSGSLTAMFTKNTDGSITSQGPDIVAYDVAGDGALTVDPLGEPITGVVSPTGAFGVLAGPTAAMTNPRMYLLMRR